MKLAEALALRAEATRRIEQLRARVIANARYQEGEEPTEDAAVLLTESSQVCGELESLIQRINRTNASAQLGAETITDALARRDVLKLRHGLITAAADAAAGRERGWNRQLRSELTFISALPVADLRAQADDLARSIRELDTDIQRTNWEVDLLDGCVKGSAASRTSDGTQGTIHHHVLILNGEGGEGASCHYQLSQWTRGSVVLHHRGLRSRVRMGRRRRLHCSVRAQS